MKKIVKFICAFLCFALLLGEVPAFCITAEAASIMEVYEEQLFKEETFIVTKEANARNVPYSKHGSTVIRLHVGDVITSDTYAINSYGNVWQRFSTPDGQTAYYYAENLKIHNEHTYSTLTNCGFSYEFCEVCGHLKPLQDIYEVPFDGTNEDYQKLHLALTIISLCPGIGTAADITEGLLYLKEGNTAEALMSFASVIPLADAIEMLKYSDEIALVMNKSGKFVSKNMDEIADSTNDVAGVVLGKTKTGVKVSSRQNTYYLKKNMNNAYKETGDLRYFKNPKDPKYSWAAHHIVSIKDPRAASAVAILETYKIDLNSAINGVYLPMRSGISNATLHVGKHSSEYYDTLNDMLSRCSSREEVEDVLNKIANLLLEDNFPL